MLRWLLLANLSLSPAIAGEHPWWRRVATGLACAASAVDVWSTKYAVDRGAVELNPWLSDPVTHKPIWTRINAVKLALCGGTIVAGEAHVAARLFPSKISRADSDKLVIAATVPMTLGFGLVSARNIQTGNSLENRK